MTDLSLRRLPVATALAAALLFAGCATTKKQPSVTAQPQPTVAAQPDLATRFADTSGTPRIKISLGSQRAYFYKGDELVTSTRVSTGKSGFSTPRGSFTVTQKERNHISGTYGKIFDASGATVSADADARKDSVPQGGKFVGAPMPYFMRFNGGIGMHAGRVPNYPASHGCVRLPRRMAQLFYEHTPLGTPVRVTD